MVPLDMMLVDELGRSRQGFSPSRNVLGRLGQCFAYSWTKMHAALQRQGCSLPWFLTGTIASFLLERNSRRKITFWYEPYDEDHFRLDVTGAGNINLVDTLAQLPGFYDHGQDVITEDARPILHWDRNNVIRTHAVLPFPQQMFGKYLLEEYGPDFPVNIRPVSQEEYEKVRDHPQQYYETCAVPQEEVQPFPGRDGASSCTTSWW